MQHKQAGEARVACHSFAAHGGLQVLGDLENFCLLTETDLGRPAQVRSINGMTGLGGKCPSWKVCSPLFCRCLNSWAGREPHRLLAFFSVSIGLSSHSPKLLRAARHLTCMCTVASGSVPQAELTGPFLECCMN